MRVLITNSALALRGGTEAHVQDLAIALRRAGHDVVAYSNILGEAAADLGAAGVTVIDNLEATPWMPDVLHCHHNMEAMTALLHFPGVPAVFVSHGWTKWLDAPVRHPRVRHYVAVDGPTRDALVDRHGLPPAAVRLIPNFVDLTRFTPRGPLFESRAQNAAPLHQSTARCVAQRAQFCSRRLLNPSRTGQPASAARPSEDHSQRHATLRPHALLFETGSGTLPTPRERAAATGKKCRLRMDVSTSLVGSSSRIESKLDASAGVSRPEPQPKSIRTTFGDVDAHATGILQDRRNLVDAALK
jgi:glycosyltransferase involved in cell wall biosynthesis